MPATAPPAAAPPPLRMIALAAYRAVLGKPNGPREIEAMGRALADPDAPRDLASLDRYVDRHAASDPSTARTERNLP